MARYFEEGLKYEFLRYFLLFRSAVHFPEHVGRPCNRRWVARMKSQFLLLERAHASAKAEMDFERVSEIETGKFRLR